MSITLPISAHFLPATQEGTLRKTHITGLHTGLTGENIEYKHFTRVEQFILEKSRVRETEMKKHTSVQAILV